MISAKMLPEVSSCVSFAEGSTGLRKNWLKFVECTELRLCVGSVTATRFTLWSIKLLVWTDRERNWWKQFLTTEDSLYVDFSVLRQLLDVPAPPAPDLLKRYKRQARYERQKDRL